MFYSGVFVDLEPLWEIPAHRSHKHWAGGDHLEWTTFEASNATLWCPDATLDPHMQGSDPHLLEGSRVSHQSLAPGLATRSKDATRGTSYRY